jgi:hypothetical protein
MPLGAHIRKMILKLHMLLRVCTMKVLIGMLKQEKLFIYTTRCLYQEKILMLHLMLQVLNRTVRPV